MWNAVNRRRLDRRRLEHRHIEEWQTPSVRPRRTDRDCANEELRLLGAPYRAADHDRHALPVDLLHILGGGNYRCKRGDVDAGVGAAHIERGKGRHAAQQLRQMVALDIGHMVGLGRCEQHPIDVRAAQQFCDDAAVAVAKTFQDGGKREPGVVEGLAAGQ